MLFLIYIGIGSFTTRDIKTEFIILSKAVLCVYLPNEGSLAGFQVVKEPISLSSFDCTTNTGNLTYKINLHLVFM